MEVRSGEDVVGAGPAYAGCVRLRNLCRVDKAARSRDSLTYDIARFYYDFRFSSSQGAKI